MDASEIMLQLLLRRPSWRSAACTVFFISMAVVNSATPPGTVVTAPAVPTQEGTSTSPTSTSTDDRHQVNSLTFAGRIQNTACSNIHHRSSLLQPVSLDHQRVASCSYNNISLPITWNTSLFIFLPLLWEKVHLVCLCAQSYTCSPFVLRDKSRDTLQEHYCRQSLPAFPSLEWNRRRMKELTMLASKLQRFLTHGKDICKKCTIASAAHGMLVSVSNFPL